MGRGGKERRNKMANITGIVTPPRFYVGFNVLELE